MWNIIEKGPLFTSKTFGDRTVPKKSDDYDKDDSKKMTVNFQAMNILCCALDATEYNLVSGCETTNTIWKLFEVTHEGTN